MDLAVLLGFLVSQVGEVAGDGVVGLSRLSNEVQGDHGELAGGACLEKQDLISLGDVHDPAQFLLGLLKDLNEHL